MKKFVLEHGDLYVSKDIAKQRPIKNLDDAREFYSERLNLLFKSQPRFREFIDLYGKINKLENYAVLAAHGEANGRWTYYDGEKELNVQNWINRHDGDYSGLLLCVCNPGHYTPKIKKSALLIADRDILEGTGIFDDPVYNLLIPGNKEIDSYTIDFEIEQLKKQLENK